jgi:hypothetical protein
MPSINTDPKDAKSRPLCAWVGVRQSSKNIKTTNATHERTGFGTIYWPLQLENTLLNHPRKHAHDGTKHKIFRDPTLSRRSTHVMSDYGGNPWIFLNSWGTRIPPQRFPCQVHGLQRFLPADLAGWKLRAEMDVPDSQLQEPA